MKFGPIPTSDAEGSILAHTINLSASRLRKGRILTLSDVSSLEKNGISTVTVAQLEDGDIHEDSAAEKIAVAATGKNVERSEAFTGRSNLISSSNGIAIIEENLLNKINAVHESITVATVPPFSVVKEKQILATVKIIPFSAPEESVTTAVNYSHDTVPLVNVSQFRDRSVGLIQTTGSSIQEKVLNKTLLTITHRVERYGAGLKHEIRCPHLQSEVSKAIQVLLKNGSELILIVGASAIVDRRDVIPSAIEETGGYIERFGMPVDPGNLLLLAYNNKVPIIGAPGCARSPKFNGFDSVLARLLADIQINASDIGSMGPGGLLTELDTRSHLKDAENNIKARPTIGAIILAGGLSRRTGKSNKLLARLNETSMLGVVVDTILSTSAHPVVVVTGHDSESIEQSLKGKNVLFTHNSRFSEGISTSLQQGIRAMNEAAPEANAALVCLGDMPLIEKRHLEKLISAFSPEDGRSICVPTYNGKRGNPVLWCKSFFSEFESISGDVGARHLIGKFQDIVCEVEMDNDSILVDVDTTETMRSIGIIPQKSPDNDSTV